MVFNDTSTKDGLLQRCELYTGLGDAAISGDTNKLKYFTSFINSNYHKIVTMILDSQDEWDFDDINHTTYPIGTIPLVASQRDYTLPASLKILRLKRVDITYDGTNYYKAEPFDTGETSYGLGNDTTTDGRFSKTSPVYDLIGNAIRIYPLASTSDVTAGAKIRIEFWREIDSFTTSDTTQEPGIDEPFHNMIAVGASLDYAVSTQDARKSDLSAMFQDYEVRLRRYYGQKTTDRVHTLKPIFINYD